MSGATLDNLSTESRSFPPPDGFAEQANATAEWYDRADADRDGFWAEQADRLSWVQRRCAVRPCGLASDPKRSAAFWRQDEEDETPTMADSGPTLSNLSNETRSFPPSAEFAAQANATEDWYSRGDEDREAFWAEQADRLTWAQKWDKVLEWDAPFAKWFVGGKLNVAVQLRRPARRGRARRPGRVPLGGRARRQPHHHLRRPAARGLQGGQRADRARRAGGRPGRHPACR